MSRQKYNISAIVFLDLKRRNRSVGPNISHPPKALYSVEFFHEVNERNDERCIKNSEMRKINETRKERFSQSENVGGSSSSKASIDVTHQQSTQQ